MDDDAQPTPRPWALAAETVLAAHDTTTGGLTTDEAKRRRLEAGPNRLEEAPPTGPLRLVLRQFASPLIAILIAAAAVTLALGKHVDTIVITLALLLNAVIGFAQERKAEQSMRSLRGLARSRARVLRDGREHELDAEDLVPGDVILLEAGMKAPADARILHATGLEADEAVLTGESAPVAKHAVPDPEDASVADRASMLHQGTVVTRGSARAVITATGRATELGRIAGSLEGMPTEPTPLQQRMGSFARLIGASIIVICAIGLVGGLALGDPLEPLVLSLVALAVAAIPEGLPIVLTVALAISMRRMARRGAIIRRLPAVETLGSCSAIGSDKTGTLTRNEMTVRSLAIGPQRLDVTGTGLSTAGTILDPDGGTTSNPTVERTLLAAALCNDARAVAAGEAFDAIGDPTEVALLVAAAKAGIDRDTAEERHRRLAELPFDSDLRYMATVNRDGQGATLFAKGAPEEVLALCSSEAGRPNLDRTAVLAVAERMAAEGLRVLAVAERRLDHRAVALADPAEHLDDLELLGLVGMIDPPRDEAIAAVRACQSAGIRVVMITGDHAATALAIARQLGIARGEAQAVTGADLQGLRSDDLDELIRQTAVFARVSPQDKLAIVEALRRIGCTVAVTGDGVNDAPALKAADIGIAMGLSGTDVAREAADMVITDDDFASIVAAVEEGRIAFDNVRKTTFFLLSTGAAAVIAVLASIFGRFDAPFIAVQMIWLNVVTNGVQDVALAFEPGEPDVLDRAPRPEREGILSRLLWERLAIAGIVMAIGTVGLFLHDLRTTGDLERARTVALTTMVLFQAFHVGNARSEHGSILRRSPLSNRFLLLGTAAALGIHIAAMHWGPTQRILQLQPLDLRTWATMIAVASTILLAMEAHKLLRGPRRGE